ncbi:MAG: TonB-dependent receptor plug domain-containing protein, partial [Rhodothermales bacterium]|nr:TonB-dependent receptor plug domain-containing protein [Rhodothermales bacterium]
MAIRSTRTTLLRHITQVHLRQRWEWRNKMQSHKTLNESILNRINNVRLNMFKPKQITCPSSSPNTHKASAMLTASLALIASAAISAQETDQSDSSSEVIEEIEVVGTRATVQRSIDLKRTSTQIVDGMSADEIGDIPALSIGEALELVTGATSHRENGGATEISVRGLGPFLGTTVVNGREATNGGGNRAVNFSIFPSELFNKIAIHKTQSAEYIEGAVSGQIHLDTKKPLVYGKRLAQANVKLAYSPDESNIQGGQDYGSRATLAYIDQFEFDNGIRLGVSLGAQVRDETNPEQEYQTTSGGGRLEACELTSLYVSNALPTETDGRCHDGSADVSNDEIQDLIDSNPNYNSVADIPFAYIPRDHRYRQNSTDDEREAIFGSFQLQPNDRLDVTFDFQYSERDQRELRKDMQFGT